MDRRKRRVTMPRNLGWDGRVAEGHGKRCSRLQGEEGVESVVTQTHTRNEVGWSSRKNEGKECSA